MEFRSVGRSGLRVSVAGLGCNNFGTPHRRGRARGRSSTRRSTRASRSSTPPTSTAPAVGGVPRRGRSAGRRHEVVIATKFGMRRWATGRTRRGGSRALHRARRRGEPAPARHRLHRPLPDALPDPNDADRGDDRRPRPTSCTRARCATSAARTSPAGRSPMRTGPRETRGSTRFVVAQNEYSLLDREVDASSCRPASASARAPPLLPAGRRLPHRQVPPRRAGARGQPARRRQRRPVAHRGQLHPDRSAHRVRGRARPHGRRARAGVAGFAARRLLRDRRRDPARAGSRERRRGRVATHRDDRRAVDALLASTR